MENQTLLCKCIERLAHLFTPQHLAMVLHGASVIQLSSNAADSIQSQITEKLNAFDPR